MRISSLQAGRGIAAVAVVLHHANLASRDFGNVSISLLDYGWAGVDFFFVLSGFIITWSAPGKRPAEFAWHRVRRVVLPYLPIGIAMGGLYSLLPSISSGAREWSWLTTLTLLPLNADTALSVAWTLKHEMLFYGVFFLTYFSGRFYLGLGLWTVGIIVATITGLDWLALRTINLEFLFGVAACAAVRRQLGDWRFLVLALTSFAAWVMAGASRESSVLFGLAIAFVLPPVILAELRGRFSISPILVYLGTTSYSIYLAHGLAISVGARIMPNLFFLAVLGLLGGLVYYYCVEKPILRLFRSRDQGEKVAAADLVIK